MAVKFIFYVSVILAILGNNVLQKSLVHYYRGKDLDRESFECYLFSIKALSNMPASSPYKIHVLHDGYSRTDPAGMDANCTCTLVRGPTNIIVDTMTAWDKDVILEGLRKHNVKPEDIKLCISTHGHSDHLGNNNLFLEAKHVVGYSVSFKDRYFDHSFEYGEELVVDDFVKVIPTPGHTLTDVTCLVQTDEYGLVAITGDLFEKEEDLVDESLWMVSASSESPRIQEANRNKILLLADYIIPGHGPMFKVTNDMKSKIAHRHSDQHYI